MSANVDLTPLQKRVLSNIQSHFPLAPRPYEVLGSQVEAPEEEVRDAVVALRDAGVIRRMGAIFDSHKLGYKSTLCAIAAPPERIEEVADIISAYPNVTHNYEREDRYNVWFTLIAPSRERIKEILDEIAEKTGIDDILDLPAIRLFKIKVDFDFTGDRKQVGEKPPVVRPAQTKSVQLDGKEKALVRLLQDDLPASLTPYAEIAKELTAQGFHVDEGWVIETAQRWKDQGVIRRFGAAIKHHKTGFTCNAMGVWTVPEDQLDELGPILASFKEVSHCYERPSVPTWPANTYTMIHGTSKDECAEVARKLQEATGLPQPRLLYSTREFKKISMSYFSEDR